MLVSDKKYETNHLYFDKSSFKTANIKLEEDILTLVKPSKCLKNDVMDYRREHLEFGESSIYGCAGLIYYTNFEEWLRETNSIVSKKLTREGVNATTLFTIRKSDHKLIGSIQLRHWLSNELIQYGGQIGYGIRPNERGKGYATKQLALMLSYARAKKINKVMIMCEKNNIASANTILHNGGVLEQECYYSYTGQMIQKYWIYL